MQIILRCTDGNEYASDVVSDEEMLAEFNGDVSAKDFAIEQMLAAFKDLKDLTHVSLEIGGSTKIFNPTNIVYVEIVK